MSRLLYVEAYEDADEPIFDAQEPTQKEQSYFELRRKEVLGWLCENCQWLKECARSDRCGRLAEISYLLDRTEEAERAPMICVCHDCVNQVSIRRNKCE